MRVFDYRSSRVWVVLASLGVAGCVATFVPAAASAPTAATAPGAARSILFIGNSFTYGQGSPVRFYHAESVTDLNHEGIGGVPALFKAFALQAGLNYDVFLESHSGASLEWHLANRLDAIRGHAWDAAILQGYSTLDPQKPGDPAELIRSVDRLVAVLRDQNRTVGVRLTATWARADQTYLPDGAWFGKPLDAMTHDVQVGYERAAASAPGILGVVPVGKAWLRAIETGLADANPYDGIEAGKIDLWTYDGYHASAYGYYLEALMVFGSVTGRDPRSLGDSERAGFELGFAPAVVHALQAVAFDALAAGPAAGPGAAVR